MPKTIKPADLGKAIEQELTVYSREVTEKIDAAGRKAMRTLVNRTVETAPIGDRRGGNFAASISSKEIKSDRGSSFVWFVKPPNHRLTHLLVHGHAKLDGGRTKANPFLKNALDEVLPEYEEAVKEAIKQ